MTKEEFEAPILAALGIKPMKVIKMSKTPAEPTPAPPIPIPENRPPHEHLIDEFVTLDNECQELIQKLTTGRILYECLPPEGAESLGELMEKMVSRFHSFQEYLTDQVERRNAKLQEAATAMRSTVIAPQEMVRGPEGGATTLRYGPFEVSSRTTRSINKEILFNEIQQQGLYERLLDLETANSTTGEMERAVKMEWKISYNAVKNWLREQNLGQIFDNAYEEEEATPAVSGPKPLALIGEVDKSKKGKK